MPCLSELPMGAAQRYLAVGRLLGILVHREGEVAAGSLKHQGQRPVPYTAGVKMWPLLCVCS